MDEYAMFMLTKWENFTFVYNVVMLLVRLTLISAVWLFQLINVSENVLPSINVDCDKLCHLSHTQQQELLQLLDEFACCFSNKPGLCTRRRLMTDFQKNSLEDSLVNLQLSPIAPWICCYTTQSLPFWFHSATLLCDETLMSEKQAINNKLQISVII